MNDKLRLLQVGCGSISGAWLDTLANRDDIEYVGLVDINIDNAKEKQNQFNLNCKLYKDYKKAINELKPDIVIDTTIPKIHHQVVTYALNNDCHVFGEKPLSNSMHNALDMIATSKKNNKYYSVMQNRRYISNIAAFSSLINKKKIGELGFLNADFYIEAHFGGFREIMENPLILDMAIHSFDQARYISGSTPISVYCHEFNPSGSWYQGNASAVCIFEMSNNVVFLYNGSWCAKGNSTSWECNWRAMGSLGAASWDGFNKPWYELVSEKNSNDKFPNKYNRNYLNEIPQIVEGHKGCIENMLESLKMNVASNTDCHDNIKSLAMVMGAIKSSKEQRKVFINELV